MYKDIFVHLDSGERSVARLEVAISLAKRFEARLVGVFGQLDNYGPSTVAGGASDRYSVAAVTARRGFEKSTAAAGIDADWIQVSHGERNFLIREMVIYCRYADLVVVGQFSSEDDQNRLPSELNEEIIRQSGVPVLVLPSAGEVSSVGERIMVAWNRSRECARAVHDALPFFADADKVRVLGLHPRTGDESPSVVPSIVWRLSRFDADIRYDVIDPQDSRIMDAILSRASDVEADLLVMGAYGQHGFPFLQRGEGTDYILRHLTLPTVLSHS